LSVSVWVSLESRVPVWRSQIATVRSSLAVASTCPSGLNAASRRIPLWVRVAIAAGAARPPSPPSARSAVRAGPLTGRKLGTTDPRPARPATGHPAQTDQCGESRGTAFAVVVIVLLVVALLSADPDADLFPRKQEYLTGHAGDVNAVATAELDGRPVIVAAGSKGVIRAWGP
jgi:hypothetical protein